MRSASSCFSLPPSRLRSFSVSVSYMAIPGSQVIGGSSDHPVIVVAELHSWEGASGTVEAGNSTKTPARAMSGVSSPSMTPPAHEGLRRIRGLTRTTFRVTTRVFHVNGPRTGFSGGFGRRTRLGEGGRIPRGVDQLAEI